MAQCPMCLGKLVRISNTFVAECEDCGETFPIRIKKKTSARKVPAKKITQSTKNHLSRENTHNSSDDAMYYFGSTVCWLSYVSVLIIGIIIAYLIR